MKRSILALAKIKLLGQDHEEEPCQESQDLAVLGTRLALVFDEHSKKAQEMEVTLVEKHMRIAYTVPQHRETISSGYSSEPLLAEAAAQEMSEMEDILDVLGEHVQSGIVVVGEKGELVGRLLLSLAHQRVVTRLHPGYRIEEDRHVPDSVFNQPVKLLDFLSELLGDENRRSILSSRPHADVRGMIFADAFKDATIRLTHFAEGGDESALSTRAILAAYIRGFAFTLGSFYPDIDIVLPVNLSPPHLPLQESSMTAILISLHPKVKLIHNIVVDSEELPLFPHSNDDRRPFLVLSMNLGTDPKSQWTNDSGPQAPSDTDNAESSVRRDTGDSDADEPELEEPLPSFQHPRYWIQSTGCTSQVYGVISDGEDDKYAGLLRARRRPEIPEDSPYNVMAFRGIDLGEYGQVPEESDEQPVGVTVRSPR